MAEVVIATAVLGIVVVAGLNAVGQSAKTARMTGETALAASLADSLLGEMMAKPAFTEFTPGREPDEVGQPRSAYDDVNDYVGWAEVNPVDADGVAIPGATGLSRVTGVTFVRASDPRTSVAPADADALVVRVRVGRGTRVLARRTAVRTLAVNGGGR